MAKTAKTKGPPRFIPAALLKDPRFAGVQQDFLRVILCKESYTIAEATKTVSDFLNNKE